jgi:ADP-heptose:LPS heptosyltransferase
MNVPDAPRRILVSRTDRLGDCILTLPLCGLLRERYPSAEVVFLARSYTRPFVERSRHVAEVADWGAMQKEGASGRAAALRALRCDTALHVFPRRPVAAAVHRAGITRRIGTGRRWFHWLHCTDRVWLSRRGSPWHEAQLNALVAGPLLGLTTPPTLESLATRYGLDAPAPGRAVRERLDGRRFNLIVHPLSSGSAPRWPLDRFTDLVAAIPAGTVNVIVTGLEPDRAVLGPWMAGLPRAATEAIGLAPGDFVALVAAADGLVASPTGPLHLAAALGIHALGIYPNTESSPEVRRWRPVGLRAEVVTPPSPCPDCARLGSRCPCVSGIAAADLATVVERWVHEGTAAPR